ncbi:hypothetical protein BS47DRAFT_1353882 [Hydnum rufescens UP504]|uniref:Uncharacterized protein n=1 Tax=Hydnum rufescens UP504 TaxID=1448309 RepID=A0A9P6AGT2_9AGAM|nr:hypothetical protein BS47DRAFT_1353882 [Hydnum rufescens UP504]
MVRHSGRASIHVNENATSAMYSICEPIRPFFTFPHWRQPVPTPDRETSSYTVDSTYPGSKTSSETATVQPSV